MNNIKCKVFIPIELMDLIEAHKKADEITTYLKPNYKCFVMSNCLGDPKACEFVIAGVKDNG